MYISLYIHSSSQQEYSSRQAGIVVACLISILLVVICGEALKSRKDQQENEKILQLAKYRILFAVNSEVNYTRLRLKRCDIFQDASRTAMIAKEID